MKTMKIYEPAMCCSTGCCGASIDPTLLRVAGTIETLRREAGIIVGRGVLLIVAEFYFLVTF